MAELRGEIGRTGGICSRLRKRRRASVLSNWRFLPTLITFSAAVTIGGDRAPLCFVNCRLRARARLDRTIDPRPQYIAESFEWDSFQGGRNPAPFSMAHSRTWVWMAGQQISLFCMHPRATVDLILAHELQKDPWLWAKAPQSVVAQLVWPLTALTIILLHRRDQGKAGEISIRWWNARQLSLSRSFFVR